MTHPSLSYYRLRGEPLRRTLPPCRRYARRGQRRTRYERARIGRGDMKQNMRDLTGERHRTISDAKES